MDGRAMTDHEAIIRRLLEGRVQVQGVAQDTGEAYRILGADLEAAMREPLADAAYDAVWEYRFG